jgi:hypothetical protein
MLGRFFYYFIVAFSNVFAFLATSLGDAAVVGITRSNITE